MGADPYDLVALADGRIAGILRGRDALVLLDPALHETARVASVRSPSAIAVYAGRPAGAFIAGDLLVASELDPFLAHYRVGAGSVERLADVAIPARAVRGIATGPEGVVHLVEEHDGTVVTLHLADGSSKLTPVGPGPIAVRRTKSALFVALVTGHALVAFPVDARGDLGTASTVTIDGPFWGLAARDVPGEVVVLAGGAEDHPLDRREGFFGWIDSFVYTYRWTAKQGFVRIAASNVSEHGLVVPKAITFVADRRAIVTSYGGERSIRFSWGRPSVETFATPPGTRAIVATPAGIVAANPLLDAWVNLDTTTTVAVPDDTPRSARERLGEALFFTSAMAPNGSSEDARSRFSCETCHFEGYVDGRTHHTGRGDVRATTKPLVGLFENRPYFSRALDPDLAAVAENEFRVAGASSSADVHFALDRPWMRDLGLPPGPRDATELRRSLMAFLEHFTHRTNPRASEQRTFTAAEARGARSFRDTCEGCHQARAVTDDATSRVPFDRWESLVLGGGRLVWASDVYARTGVEPYVHEAGARVPSLRRLYKKTPYFTNGSASSLHDVLRRVRVAPFAHDGAIGQPLDVAMVDDLAAFLDLL